MNNPAFGCPSAFETSRVLQMRRDGLGVDGHVTEEVDKSSRLYMAEHKCRFLKKGETVDFEWSNVQKLEPASLGYAVCIRFPGSDACAYTPKNFAESRSFAVQEDSPKAPPAAEAAPRMTAETAPDAPGPAASAPITPLPDSPTRTTRARPRTSNRIELSPL